MSGKTRAPQRAPKRKPESPPWAPAPMSQPEGNAAAAAQIPAAAKSPHDDSSDPTRQKTDVLPWWARPDPAAASKDGDKALSPDGTCGGAPKTCDTRPDFARTDDAPRKGAPPAPAPKGPPLQNLIGKKFESKAGPFQLMPLVFPTVMASLKGAATLEGILFKGGASTEVTSKADGLEVAQKFATEIGKIGFKASSSGLAVSWGSNVLPLEVEASAGKLTLKSKPTLVKWPSEAFTLQVRLEFAMELQGGAEDLFKLAGAVAAVMSAKAAEAWMARVAAGLGRSLQRVLNTPIIAINPGVMGDLANPPGGGPRARTQ